MKYLFLIGLLVWIVSDSQGQTKQVKDDFEGGGTISSWFGDECTIDKSFSNPKQNGINTSASVLKYHDEGGLYANVRFDVANNFNLVSNHTFTLKIFVPSEGLSGNQTNKVSLKLQDGTIGAPWSTQSEILKQVALDVWQEISFDFESDAFINLDPTSMAPTQRSDFNRVVIQVNGENNTDHVLAYIDDFTYDGSIEADPEFTQLIWADEFDGNGDIDQNKWFRQHQLPIGGGWYNGELQHYTDRLDNSYLENGILKVVAKKETYNDQGVTKNYTSARLNSKFTFKYGKVEVHAKLPSGVGTWPAIWMLGKNINEDGAYWDNQGYGTTAWPACGEIDIMEHWGSNQNFVQSATHTPSSYGSTVNHGGQTISTVSSEFHVYTLQWTEDKLVFSVDDMVHYTYKPDVKNADTWPFDDEQYLLFNVAIQSTIDPNFQEGAMEIDYIRVYQQDEATAIKEPTNQENKAHIYPNPVSNELQILFDEDIQHELRIKIYNTSGRLIKTYSKIPSNNYIRISDFGCFPKGVYLIHVESDTVQQCLKVMKD
ncbi:family 16 glycosylhydrolase [Carboxylicivirga sp. N1Y90]|uniref:family 16 glycosylhydrolase n=1 Tax=Carboxylicivirga fragile TaxID=3417571 RepID=UPI003D358C82|nr:family 16 glycosylhydrolase [Marinilabiliaceae bacterium N1Y90]